MLDVIRCDTSDGGLYFCEVDSGKVAAFQKLADDVKEVRVSELGYQVQGVDE